MSLEISYTLSKCKNCRFNKGYMPCCNKVYCEMLGLTDAKKECNLKV